MRRVQEIFRPVQNIHQVATICADHPHESTSQRYSFIPTTAPLQVLADYGWQPVAVAEQRVRDASKAGYQRHAVKFRNESFSRVALQVGQTLPELILINSHSGNAAFQLFLGLFELICSNGLMAERGNIAERRILHRGYTSDKVAEAITAIAPNVQPLLAEVDEMRRLQLDGEEQKAFATAAIELRWDSEKYTVAPERVNQALRRQQRDNSLWSTYNRVQESVTRGGMYVRNNETRQTHRARAVASLSENVRLNKALWTLTETMRNLKKSN